MSGDICTCHNYGCSWHWGWGPGILPNTPQCPGWRPTENGTALMSTVLRRTDPEKGEHGPSGLQVKSGECSDCVHGPLCGVGVGVPLPSAGSALDLAEGSPRRLDPTPTHRLAMEVSRGWHPAHLEFRISSTCLGVNAKMHGLS